MTCRWHVRTAQETEPAGENDSRRDVQNSTLGGIFAFFHLATGIEFAPY